MKGTSTTSNLVRYLLLLGVVGATVAASSVADAAASDALAAFAVPRGSRSLSATTNARSFVGAMRKQQRQRPPPSSSSSSSSSLHMKHTLVLVRHGESTWNKENLFTGWVDVPLSETGEKEALAGAKLLREQGFHFDLAYTSTLKRAIKTLWIILEEMDLMYIPIVNTWRLNERHYGALQGLNKQETVARHGKEQVLIWRRSYDIPPPPVGRESDNHPSNDPRYVGVDFDDSFTESLKLTEARFMPDWTDAIGPDIKSGKKVLVAAHGNTLRALVKHLDGISEEDICELNIPTGIPLVYELDDDLKPIPHPDAIAPLTGRYLGDQDEIRNRIGAVLAQTG